MVSEIRSQLDIGSMLHNISTITLTKAQKRWRLAYFSIYFSNTMLSIAKVSKNLSQYPISEIVAGPSYTTLKIIPKATNNPDHDHHSDGFSSIDQSELSDLVKNKDLEIIGKFNGVAGLAESLQTDLENGINGQDTERRKIVFGSNTYKKPPPKGFFYFVVEAFKDTTILILLACAALSLGFGIKEEGAREGWYEGGSIFVAVFLVIAVSAVSNFRQERQFDRLSKISNNIKIDVIRESRRQKISIFDVVVGDVVILNIGDQIPADGLFIDGHSFLVDESSMTGESDHIDIDAIQHPFLISGSKVADGHGRMLVISVGMNTGWGKMMSSITGDSDEQTPLQSRLNKLTTSIGKVGLSVAFLVLVVMLIRYFTGNTEDEDGNREYNGRRTDTNEILNSVTLIFAAAVTIVVVAIPEGLPLAVKITLAYSMKRMMADQAKVRKKSACETMGSATVICTDKTGTLTMNRMKVTEFWLGLDQIEDDSSIDAKVLQLYHQGVGLNTTGSVYKSVSRNTSEYCQEELEDLKDMCTESEYYNNFLPLKFTWTFPCFNFLKLNTDGSSKGNPGPSSFGGLIRDCNGRWLCGYMGKMNGRRYTALEAEVCSIFQGMRLIKEMDLSFLLIETDCLVAVRLTMKKLHNDHPLKPAIDAIKAMMLEQRCTMIHTKRDGNHCADQLAKLGGKQSEEFIMLENPPKLLIPYLLRDIEAASNQFQRNPHH